jgi:hypothetical protein
MADFLGMRVQLLVVLVAVCSSASAKTALLEHVPLQWKSTSELRLDTLEMAQIPIHFEIFQDGREN